MLQREELPAIAERIGGQEPQFRESVEDDVLWLGPLDLREDLPRRLPELDLRGVENDVLQTRR